MSDQDQSAWKEWLSVCGSIASVISLLGVVVVILLGLLSPWLVFLSGIAMMGLFFSVLARVFASNQQTLTSLGQIDRPIHLVERNNPALLRPEPMKDAIPRFTDAEARIANWALSLTMNFLNLIDVENFSPNDTKEATGIVPVKVAVVRFYYEPDRDVPSQLDVIAHLYVSPMSSENVTPILDTVWRGSKAKSVRFTTGHNHELIIAFVPAQKPDQGFFWEFYETAPSKPGGPAFFRPNVREINETEYRIKIQLVGKVQGVVIYNNPFHYLLSLAPVFSIRKAAAD